MSLVMEDQSQPVFRDFLGSSAAAPNNLEPKQPALSATDSVRVSQNTGFMEQEDGEASVRGGSTFSAPCPSSAPGPNFPSSSDPGTELWRHGKAPAAMGCSHAIKATNMNDDITRKREEAGNRGPYRETDGIEGSRPSKASRLKQRENDALPSTGDLGLTMQPPRTSQAGNMWLQTSVFNPSAGTSKRLESSRPTAAGVPLLARPVQAAAAATAGATGANGMFSRNPASSILPPPADEGSRTGLQGGIAALINSANAKLPTARTLSEPTALERTTSLDRPKLPVGSDSILPSHKTSTTSVTRQLTIFYGGHAHVFDDVSPDKADAIMQMAGSNGRSWSTTYAHRSSRSEGSLADLRREKAAIGATSLPVPADNNQNVVNHAGLQRKHRIPADHQAMKAGIPGDVPVPSGFPVGDGNRFAMANGRAASGYHGSFYGMKDAASNGQHWV